MFVFIHDSYLLLLKFCFRIAIKNICVPNNSINVKLFFVYIRRKIYSNKGFKKIINHKIINFNKFNHKSIINTKQLQ